MWRCDYGSPLAWSRIWCSIHLMSKLENRKLYFLTHITKFIKTWIDNITVYKPVSFKIKKHMLHSKDNILRKEKIQNMKQNILLVDCNKITICEHIVRNLFNFITINFSNCYICLSLLKYFLDNTKDQKSVRVC